MDKTLIRYLYFSRFRKEIIDELGLKLTGDFSNDE